MRSSSGQFVRPSAKTPIRAVFFDLDDTLFDHSRTAARALGRLRSTVPALRAREAREVARRYGELLDEIYPSVLAGRTTHERARVERFSRLLEWAGHPVDRKEAELLSTDYRRQYQELRVPVAGARQMLDALPRSLTIGIVSNNHQSEQVEKLEAIGLAGRFDFVLTSERAGYAKPDPRIFHAALAEAGASAGEAVMVGDSWGSDVVGARAAGLPVVWFNRAHRTPPEPWAVRQLRSWAPPARVAARLLAAREGTRRSVHRDERVSSSGSLNG
ncbi:MAG: HAD family hydrolase [Thermoplasmata archaeon]|nr:HAD family hydrolase [Thermoplasmata archaeon]